MKIINLLVLFSFSLLAQELPPITTFNQNSYHAGIQNWMLSQNTDGFIYVANNEGLLEYNGSKWTLYPTPNNSIMRSVLCDDKIIYSGAYMNFGFWSKNNFGIWQYTSINEKLKLTLKEDEQFWGIFKFNHWIIFQSLQNLYLYEPTTQKLKIIKSDSPIFKAYQTPEQLLYQNDEGLFEIENFKSRMVVSNQSINNQKIVSVLTQEEKLLLITQSNGLWWLNEQSVTRMPTEMDEILQNEVVYCATKLQNNHMAIGTISSGLIVMSATGQLIYHITQPKGLNNNTVLSIFEDEAYNLWLGLDNGLNVINKKSAIKNYSNLSGLFGTVYASIIFDSYLYIGTNQGLFYKPHKSTQDFELIKGTKGQVWSLFIHDNTLFCGHDLGTFVIDKAYAKIIYNLSGTWKFETHEDKIIQGNYYGLSSLQKVNNEWQFLNKIDGFNYSCRYFELANKNQIIVNHEYRGLFLLNLTTDLSKVATYQEILEPKKGKNSGLIKHHHQIYYTSPKGFFVFDSKKSSFVKDKKISAIFDDMQYVSGRMISDTNGLLWLFTKDYLYYLSNNKLSNELTINRLPIASNVINTMPGYENIFEIDHQTYLLGTTNGYYILNKQLQNAQRHKIFLTQITQNNRQRQAELLLNLNSNNTISYHNNNITFSLAVPQFNTYVFTEFQYILEGHQELWSDWSQNSTITFENLKPGKYTFKARAKISNLETENMIVHSFEVKKPWYGSNVAVFIYFVLGFILVYFIHKRYQKYYQHKHQKIIAENNLLLELKELENQKEIMKIRNEQLTKDVDQKNKELAASTMTLLKKDELLRIIKEDLKNTPDPSASKKIKSVINVINRSVVEDSQWDVFKEAFDKADNDFIKKVKEAHPILTPNDLRLCAYLRLNLSSKEIAPLLNISVRSVEIKRYRLRKKMNLEHEKSLVDYILGI